MRLPRRIPEYRTSVRVLSVALIVATWRGPIPCVHVHGNHSDDAASSLARHVRIYHDDEPADDVPHWHFHLVLPQDVLHTDDPANRDVPDDPLLSHQTVLQLTDTQANSSLFLRWSSYDRASAETVAPAALLKVATSDVNDSRQTVWRSGAFLTTLLHAAPLCAVTGVALC
jgi:hypothetical protein